MLELLRHIFDASQFVPRGMCGAWEPAYRLLHICSDLSIWASYMLIPMILLRHGGLRDAQQRPYVSLPLFCSFIVSCGFTHLCDVIVWWYPAYRLFGLVRGFCACASVLTVLSYAYNAGRGRQSA